MKKYIINKHSKNKINLNEHNFKNGTFILYIFIYIYIFL